MPPKQEFVSLSPESRAFVDGLVRLGVFGKSRSAVLRYLIEEGIRQTVKDDYISKYLATKEAMKNQ